MLLFNPDPITLTQITTKREQNVSPKTTPNRPIFYLIALLIPVIILVLIEGVLRIADFGKDIPLFVTSDVNSAFIQPNPKIVHRYFHHPELAPKVAPDTFLFKREKTPSTKRIILMGGSSAAGFPAGSGVLCGGGAVLEHHVAHQSSAASPSHHEGVGIVCVCDERLQLHQ